MKGNTPKLFRNLGFDTYYWEPWKNAQRPLAAAHRFLTEGLNALGRAQLLENQFDTHGLDIVCIQEGRTADDQIRAGASYD
eukprot:410291-Heterocapsa_arctica.AAC.1